MRTTAIANMLAKFSEREKNVLKKKKKTIVIRYPTFASDAIFFLVQTCVVAVRTINQPSNRYSSGATRNLAPP